MIIFVLKKKNCNYKDALRFNKFLKKRNVTVNSIHYISLYSKQSPLNKDEYIFDNQNLIKKKIKSIDLDNREQFEKIYDKNSIYKVIVFNTNCEKYEKTTRELKYEWRNKNKTNLCLHGSDNTQEATIEFKNLMNKKSINLYYNRDCIRSKQLKKYNVFI